MITYPGLPGPTITDHLTREESRALYEPGVEFHVGRIDMVANTGTYLDTPFHRFADGYDLADLPLDRVAALPGLCLAVDEQAIGPGRLAGADVAGRAVLFATGWDRFWGSDRYGDRDHPFLTTETAIRLVAGGAVLVGIDSVNIDDTSDGARPVHTTLLAAGIPVVEHLTGLDRLVGGAEFLFTAVPVAIHGLGTFPVRAFASIL